jgi:hypothetical protein
MGLRSSPVSGLNIEMRRAVEETSLIAPGIWRIQHPLAYFSNFLQFFLVIESCVTSILGLGDRDACPTASRSGPMQGEGDDPCCLFSSRSNSGLSRDLGLLNCRAFLLWKSTKLLVEIRDRPANRY